MIRVRRATLDDFETMVVIYTAAWRAGFQHMFSATVFAAEGFDSDRRAECRESIFGEATDTYVVESGEHVVGFVVARHEGADVVLDDIWVMPSWWGRGAAGALVARVEDDMRSRGGHMMSAWVPEDSPTGRRFFEKLGWSASGETDDLDAYHQEPNRLYEYLRELASVDLTRGLPRPTRSLDRPQLRPT